MYHVVMTRKRDGHQEWAAGSMGMAFSFKAAQTLVKDYWRSLGKLTYDGKWRWSNEYVTIEVKEGNGLELAQYDRKSWYKRAVIGKKEDVPKLD